MRWLLLCCLILSPFACDGGGGDVKPLWGDTPVSGLDLRAAVSATEVPLLERIDLTLDLFVAAGREADFVPMLPAGFVGRQARPVVRPVPGGVWSRYAIELRPATIGALKIPPFVVTARAVESGDSSDAGSGELKATTAEFNVTVTGVLEGAAAEVEAPRDPFATPLNLTLMRYGLGGFALLVILFLWWRRRERKIVHPTEIPLPAHVKALRELARLKSMPRIMPDEIDAFYVAVSNVLRTYLEDRFGLHAPDRTTEEFLPEVEQSGALDTGQQEHLRRFLEQTDLVKFARVVPDSSAHDAALAFAEELVESTREDRSVTNVRAPVAQEVAL